MPSKPPIPHEITQLLHRWKEGDREAFQQVVTLAYDDLRAIALGYLRRGGRGESAEAAFVRRAGAAARRDGLDRRGERRDACAQHRPR
jgi:hypothetical protein